MSLLPCSWFMKSGKFLFLFFLKTLIYPALFHSFMTDLVACLSSGEKSWGHVARLIKEQEWESIFLVTNDFGRQNFKPEKQINFVVVDFQKPVAELINDI